MDRDLPTSDGVLKVLGIDADVADDCSEVSTAEDGLHSPSSESDGSDPAPPQQTQSLLTDVDAIQVQLGNFRRKVDAKLIEKTTEVKVAERCREETQSETVEDMASQQVVPGAPGAPGHGLWKKLRLPLHFAPREEYHRYVVETRAPGLDMQNLKLSFNSDASTVVVAGVCMPTAQEQQVMWRRAVSNLEDFARRFPQQFVRLGGAPRMSKEAYGRLGKGKFGRFSQTLSIPHDVAISDIEPFYEDGKLAVVFPKRPPGTYDIPHDWNSWW